MPDIERRDVSPLLKGTYNIDIGGCIFRLVPVDGLIDGIFVVGREREDGRKHIVAHINGVCESGWFDPHTLAFTCD